MKSLINTKKLSPGALTAVRPVLTIAGIALMLVMTVIICVNVHPADAISTSSSYSGRRDLSGDMDIFANNTKGTALQGLVYISPNHDTDAGAAIVVSGETAEAAPVYVKKIYTIDDDALCGEVPDPGCYGSSSDPDVIESVIASASELLDGQATAWNRDLPFAKGTETSWYCDETILVLTWTERTGGVTYYCSEVKIAHPSQFRRMLADNTYGSSCQYLCTELAASSNAVLAMNADFYAFRERGINVYNGTLYRCVPSNLENCFIDSNGNLLVTHRDELLTEEDTQRYIAEHNIQFSISFGPILVEDGVPITYNRYTLGQTDQTAARSAIGQLGELHYLGMNANYCNISTVASALASHGVVTGYALDGGQTAETVFGGKVFNRIVYDSERSVSDIIYFATALPAEDKK